VEENREVQDLYRRAKSKHDAGTEVFVSRYQASSVWEYLAEGVNSYMTPRRDRYDPKQVVRERLEARDPELIAFVERLISIRETEPYYAVAYAVAYANAGEDRLSRNQVDEAIAFFRRSLERDPGSPEGMRGLIQSLSVKGDDEAACEEAARALRIHPEAAQVVVAAVRAYYLRDGDARARMEELLRRRGSVDAAERYLIDLELGDAAFTAGEIDSSVRAFRRVLGYQSDNPEALWGAGYALSLAGDTGGARDHFERALMRRSGLVQLRCDYATVLIEAGDLCAAEDQLSEAALLDPESSSVEAVRGRLKLERGALAEAAAHLEEALERDPDNDVARTLLAKTRLESGDPEGARKELEPLLERVESGAPPEYSYDAKRSAFRLVHTFPAHEKKLLYEVAAEASVKRSGD
jgi:tetratricopeptide (TPR) repeat protein